MPKDNFSFASRHSIPFKTTDKQKAFIEEESSSIETNGRVVFQRIMEFIALNTESGNLLMKEKTLSSNHNYEKIFILSREGHPEKYKGQDF